MNCRYCGKEEEKLRKGGLGFYYCEPCWADINKRKSESMKQKQITRSQDTRAQMSASKRVNKLTEPKKWKLYYEFYKEQLEKEEALLLSLKREDVFEPL